MSHKTPRRSNPPRLRFGGAADNVVEMVGWRRTFDVDEENSYIQVMKVFDVKQNKGDLQALLKLIEEGEEITLADGAEALAKISPLQRTEFELRPVGLAKGLFTLSSEFFEPLPEDIIEAFEGKYSSKHSK